MQRILDAIEHKRSIGYSPGQLEVDFGQPEADIEDEGYFLSKLNGWGATPITGVLAHYGEVDDRELIKKLDELDIYHCLK